MAEPFLSEIRIMSFNFAPKGWATCSGQLLPINQTQALFSLLGTTFGGDGRVNFALPNLQGRTPIHAGNGHTLGESGGQQTHTLNNSEMPQHTHLVNALNTGATSGNTSSPIGNFLATSSPATLYNSGGLNQVPLATNTVSNYGGSQAHLNMQPFLALNFSIALQGIFPSQT